MKVIDDLMGAAVQQWKVHVKLELVDERLKPVTRSDGRENENSLCQSILLDQKEFLSEMREEIGRPTGGDVEHLLMGLSELSDRERERVDECARARAVLLKHGQGRCEQSRALFYGWLVVRAFGEITHGLEVQRHGFLDFSRCTSSVAIGLFLGLPSQCV